MIQPDLFATTAPAPAQGVPAEQDALDLPAILGIGLILAGVFALVMVVALIRVLGRR